MKEKFFNTCRAVATRVTRAVGELFLGSQKDIHLPHDSFSIYKEHNVYSFLRYSEHRRMLFDLKQNRSSAWTPLVSQKLNSHLHTIRDRVNIPSSETVLVIPIPLSRWRLIRRGFNQSRVLLYQALSRHSSDLFTLETDNLIKTRETPKQAVLTRAKRLTSQRGAFAVRHPERIRNATVFIFDDISTTGATLAEASRTLMDAGAARVVCISLAH